MSLPDGLPTPARYFAALSVSAGALLLMMDASITSVAMPAIAEALHVPASRAVLTLTLYQLVLAMTIIPFAALGDHLGQQRLYRGGLVVYVASALLCLTVNSLPMLLVIRSLQALGAAAALSVSLGLIRAIYPVQYLGRGLGLNTLCSASGNALAPTVGGLILAFTSWRWIFLAGVPLALLSLLAGKHLPNVRVEPQRFDASGAMLCAATFALVILGLNALTQANGVGNAALLLLAGVIVGVFFVRHQTCQRNAVLPLDLLTHRAFALAVASSLAGVVASTTVLFSLPFSLHDRGFGPAEMGAMIAPYAVASFMIGPSAGMLSDRIAPKLLGICGIVIAIIAMALIALLPTQVAYLDVAWRVWLCGAGFALFLAPSARIVLQAAPVHRAAAAGGLVMTTRMLGQALSATLVGALLAMNLGHGPAAPLIGVALAGISMLCTLLLPKRSAAAAALTQSG